MFIFFVCFQESFCFTFKVVSVFKVPHHEIRFHVSCVQALLNSSRASVMSVIYFNGSGAAQLYCRKTRHNSDIHHGTLVFLNFEINTVINMQCWHQWQYWRNLRHSLIILSSATRHFVQSVLAINDCWLSMSTLRQNNGNIITEHFVKGEGGYKQYRWQGRIISC